MGEMTDDVEAYHADSTGDPRLAYLQWIKSIHFENGASEAVKCRKYPEFGMLYRDTIDDVIHDYLTSNLIVQFHSDGTIKSSKYGSDELLPPGEYVVSIDLGVPNSGIRFDKRNFAKLYGVDNLHPRKSDHNAEIALDFSYKSPTGRVDTNLHKAIENAQKDLRQIKEKNMNPEFLRREAARLAAAAEAWDGVPQEDVFKVGTIITFTHKFTEAGKRYNYAAVKGAAVKVDDHWYLTGLLNGQRRVTWQFLLEALGVDGVATINVLDQDGMPLKEYVAGMKKDAYDHDEVIAGLASKDPEVRKAAKAKLDARVEEIRGAAE